MKTLIRQTGISILSGLSLLTLCVSFVNAQQPFINPGFQEERILDDKETNGIIVDYRSVFQGRGTRSDVVQSRIQKEGIREGKHKRRNFFQRLFDRYQSTN